MLTMCPPSGMCGRQSRVIRISPWTFVSSTVSSSSSVPSQKGSRPRPRPALLTRIWIDPSSATAYSTKRSQLSGSVTSSSCLRSVSSSSTLRAPPRTRAPSRASAAAVAAPIPLEAPVTIAVFPSSTATKRQSLARGREKSLAPTEIVIRLLAQEERPRLQELGHIEPSDGLGSFRADPFVVGGSSREVMTSHGEAGLEPRCDRLSFGRLEVLGFAAVLEQNPSELAEPVLVEGWPRCQQLVEQRIRFVSPAVVK